MNPCRCDQAAADSASMSHIAAPSGLDERPSVPIAPRWPRPSGRKNAHRGLAPCRRPASGELCSQALIAPGKTRRLPTTARRSHLLQQSNPPSLCPPVCPVVQASRLPGPVTTFIFNSFVEPMFGWVDCAGGQCSNGELAWRFVRGPTMVAAGVAGGAVTGTVARAAGAALSNAASNSAPTAAIALLMQLSPDATVGIAQMLNVQGAEQLDQVMLLQTAEEYMSEEGAQELGQFDPMRP